MEKSLVFSATHLPAGQARAQQIGKHSSFIRDKTLPPKSVTSIGTPSTRFVPGGMFSIRCHPSKQTLVMLSGIRKNFVLRRGALGVRLVDYAALPGKKYRRFVWGESNEKCGEYRGSIEGWLSMTSAVCVRFRRESSN